MVLQMPTPFIDQLFVVPTFRRFAENRVMTHHPLPGRAGFLFQFSLEKALLLQLLLRRQRSFKEIPVQEHDLHERILCVRQLD